MEVFQAHSEHLKEISQLFDQYRVFYKASSDPEAARAFLQERFQKGDSVIFAVRHDSQIVGFTQLYPSFSSVSMGHIWILNDLFVAPVYRKQGVASFLLSATVDFARTTKATRITLSTQISNTTAQSIYESLGYCKDEDFYHYSLTL
jgi:ribosomal protein S18 acetylase RimI-like enzyme